MNAAEIEKLTSSSFALKIITSSADKEGYFTGLGNLEDILLNIALTSSPESNSFILNNNYGIKNLHSSEEILSTFELLSENFGELNPELKNAYLQNLELEYSNIIKNCTQEYECINEKLLEAEQRAALMRIDKEQIQKFRTSIESWAHTPEPFNEQAGTT